MRQFFFGLVFLYGVGLSTYFGSWGVRHRMNVAAEGNWFLLANLIAITGALGTIGTFKKND
jgi:hypothetical protein